MPLKKSRRRKRKNSVPNAAISHVQRQTKVNAFFNSVTDNAVNSAGAEVPPEQEPEVVNIAEEKSKASKKSILLAHDASRNARHAPCSPMRNACEPESDLRETENSEKQALPQENGNFRQRSERKSSRVASKNPKVSPERNCSLVSMIINLSFPPFRPTSSYTLHTPFRSVDIPASKGFKRKACECVGDAKRRKTSADSPVTPDNAPNTTPSSSEAAVCESSVQIVEVADSKPPSQLSFRSRLSRRKNAAIHMPQIVTSLQDATQTVIQSQRPSSLEKAAGKRRPRSHCTSIDVSEVIHVHATAPTQPQPFASAGRGKGSSLKGGKEDVTEVIDVESTKPPQKPMKAELHPFFKAVASASISSNKVGTFTPQNTKPLADPWTLFWSTVHINRAQPLSSDLVDFQIRMRKSEVEVKDLQLFDWAFQSSKNVSGVMSKHPQISGDEPTNLNSAEGRVSVWADLYKEYATLDKVNGDSLAELVGWLKKWYTPKKSQSRASDDDTSDSECSDYEFNSESDAECVAILTGPSGCGKTTVVRAAARQLGLSVLEINSSICRTGKKVRDIIGEALRTHRVTDNPQTSVFSKVGGSSLGVDVSEKIKAPKTLVLFEEVDELHDDEKGFWSTLQELASSEDSKRPIICTANKFSSSMQTAFGEQVSNEQLEIRRLLYTWTSEDAQNTLPFKHIDFIDKSIRQVKAVVKTVAKMENTTLRSIDVERVCLSSKSGDVRQAIHTLQFWWRHPLKEIGPSLVQDVHKSIDLFSKADPTYCTPSMLSQYEYAECATADKRSFTICQSLFRVGSSRCAKGLQKNEAAATESSPLDKLSVSDFVTVLDAFSLADVISKAPDCEELCSELSSEDMPVQDHGFSGFWGALEVASELNGHALYSVGDLVLEQDDKYASAVLREMSPNIFGDLQLPDIHAALSWRATVCEKLPALRTMVIADHRRRQQPKSSDENNPNRPSACSMGRRTRSRMRGDALRDLLLDSEAREYLMQTSIPFWDSLETESVDN